MAMASPAAEGSAPAEGQSAPQVTGAQLNVLGQYIKDLSFESPAAPEVLQTPPPNPQLQVTVNVNAASKSDDNYEVVLNIEVHAKGDTGVDLQCRAVLCRDVPPARRAAEHAPAGVVHRLPGASLPLRAPGARRRDARRRLSAADARSHRFRQALCAEPLPRRRGPGGKLSGQAPTEQRPATEPHRRGSQRRPRAPAAPRR